jgi:3-oxoadipate enol-lactonase
MKIKSIFVLTLLAILMSTKAIAMERLIVQTKMGNIIVFKKQGNASKTPLMLLHGIYFDHKLWKNNTDQINDRDVYVLDMPMHGESIDVKKEWDMNDISNMLLEIIDSLKIEKVIAVGHSWGSMTVLRAAHKSPEKFAAIGLGNMPFKELSEKDKKTVKNQHRALIFKRFYMKQTAKYLFGSKSLSENPELLNDVIRPMSKLSAKDIKYIDKVVRIDSPGTKDMIESLQVPAAAMIGEEDYVGKPPLKNTRTVQGGHVSPLEAPEETNRFIKDVIELSL